MPHKSTNVLSSRVFPATRAKSLSITRVSNNGDLFFTAIKWFIYCPYKQAGDLQFKTKESYSESL